MMRAVLFSGVVLQGGAVEDVAVRDLHLLQAQGADPIGGPPAESMKFLRSELDRFVKLVKETGYKAQ